MVKDSCNVLRIAMYFFLKTKWRKCTRKKLNKGGLKNAEHLFKPFKILGVYNADETVLLP